MSQSDTPNSGPQGPVSGKSGRDQDGSNGNASSTPGCGLDDDGEEDLDDADDDPNSLTCCLRLWRRSDYPTRSAGIVTATSPRSIPLHRHVSQDGDSAPLGVDSLELSAATVSTTRQQQHHYSPDCGFSGLSYPASSSSAPSVVTQIDYVNYFIPDMGKIFSCPYYWGKIDRYEAESLLEKQPEGSFLLRDSAQDEFVFSVSFRRYNRSLHARIEESNHRFSFDCHDPGVHSSGGVTSLLEHYKEPLSCMFFEPLLLHPVNRSRCFSLQELARAAVCDKCSYNGVSRLPLPRTVKDYLREYSYRHKIRTRQIDVS